MITPEKQEHLKTWVGLKKRDEVAPSNPLEYEHEIPMDEKAKQEGRHWGLQNENYHDKW